MRHAVKSKPVKAYQLGTGHPKEQEMIDQGVIRRLPDGRYELFSQEAVNGHGQIACPGDFFKVDMKDGRLYAYPNKKEEFLKNHTHLGGDDYFQAAEVRMIWQVGDDLFEEVCWLVNTGRLTLKPQDPDNYFNAFLWNAPLSAAADATLVFYRVDRDAAGSITDIDFNFVAKEAFEASYSIIDE